MTIDDSSALTGKRTILTGATGFIGRRVLAALTAAGAEVTAPVRSARSAAAVDAAGGRALHSGLTDRSALARACEGADALVHLAYDFRAGPDENLAAFDAVLAAARDAGVGRFVQASSVVVYDGWPDRDITEVSSVMPTGGGPYRRAKVLMEQRLTEAGMPAVILQPTIVYGPGSSLWTDRLAGALAHGGVVLPEPEGLCNAVYVDDVAQAVCGALLLDHPGCEHFLISGPEPVLWSALLQGYADIVGGTILREPADQIAAAIGPEPEISQTPSLAARISGAGRRLIGHDRFEALVNRLRPQPTGPMRPDHHLFGVFTGEGAVSISHARERLGYAPSYDLASGLAATAPYLRAKFGGTA